MEGSSSSEPPHALRGSRWLVPSAIVVTALLAFLPSLGLGYVQDDLAVVRDNRVVDRGDIREIFTRDYWAGTGFSDPGLYRPVTVLTFAVEKKLAGDLSAPRSHAANVVLHALTALALFALALRLGAGRFAAGCAGLLFAAHPIHVAAVANVVGRAELLAALFSIAALVAWSFTGSWGAGEAARAGGSASGPRGASWGAAACLFLALGSKEVAVATVALIAFHEILGRSRGARPVAAWLLERAAALAPVVLAVVVYLVLRTAALMDFPGGQPVRPMENSLVGLHGIERAASALGIAAKYAKLLIFPYPLSGDYTGSAISRQEHLVSPVPLLGLAALALPLVMVAAGLASRLRGPGSGGSTAGRRTRAASMAAALFLAPYTIVGNLFVLSGAGFAERLMYFPSAGVCLLAGLLLEAIRAAPEGRSRAKATSGVLLALVGTLAAAGVLRCTIETAKWKSDETLFAAAAQAAPGTVRAPYLLGLVSRSQGKYDDALRHYGEALRAWPEHGPSWLETGILLGRKGDLPGSEAALRRAARIDPMVAEIRMYLGLNLGLQGRLGEAERELRRAILLEPAMIRARGELAHLLYRKGEYEEAAKLYRRCVDEGWSEMLPHLNAAEERRRPAPPGP